MTNGTDSTEQVGLARSIRYSLKYNKAIERFVAYESNVALLEFEDQAAGQRYVDRCNRLVNT